MLTSIAWYLTHTESDKKNSVIWFISSKKTNNLDLELVLREPQFAWDGHLSLSAFGAALLCRLNYQFAEKQRGLPAASRRSPYGVKIIVLSSAHSFLLDAVVRLRQGIRQ